MERLAGIFDLLFYLRAVPPLRSLVQQMAEEGLSNPLRSFVRLLVVSLDPIESI
ncbi:MAG: hypothetical protein KAT41_01640 [Candidatus Marinimicrobia bacterium]|nr:hypothetical protein [Candidatus Neomarinimicrobiota bacterium]